MAESGAAEAPGVEGDAALIAGVMDGVKQSFIDEGVDPEVLEDVMYLCVITYWGYSTVCQYCRLMCVV